MKGNILNIPEDILKHFRNRFCYTQQELANLISEYFPDSGPYNKQEVDRAEHGKYNANLLLFIVDRIFRNNIILDAEVYRATRALGFILGENYYKVGNPIRGKEIFEFQHINDFIERLESVIMDLSLKDRTDLEAPLSTISSLNMEIRVDPRFPNMAAKACIHFLDEYIFTLSSVKHENFPKFEYIDLLDLSKRSLIEKHLTAIGIQIIDGKSVSEMLEFESNRLSLQQGNNKLLRNNILSKYINKINQILRYQFILENELEYKFDEDVLVFGREDIVKKIFVKKYHY